MTKGQSSDWPVLTLVKRWWFRQLWPEDDHQLWCWQQAIGVGSSCCNVGPVAAIQLSCLDDDSFCFSEDRYPVLLLFGCALLCKTVCGLIAKYTAMGSIISTARRLYGFCTGRSGRWRVVQFFVRYGLEDGQDSCSEEDDAAGGTALLCSVPAAPVTSRWRPSASALKFLPRGPGFSEPVWPSGKALGW